MVKGRATDTTLLPGSHFVPALRRRMVEEYPSVELAYRAGGPDDPEKPELNQSGPALQITLGDRTTVVVSVTVRFRLLPEQLRLVHERFGPNGIFGVARDETQRAVITTLGATEIGIDNLFGPARGDCEEHLHAAAATALTADGMELTSLLLARTPRGSRARRGPAAAPGRLSTRSWPGRPGRRRRPCARRTPGTACRRCPSSGNWSTAGTGSSANPRWWSRPGTWPPPASALVDTMSDRVLEFYAGLCGWTLARAHARSGDPVAIAEYLGADDVFDRSNEQDYQSLVAATRPGRVPTVDGV